MGLYFIDDKNVFVINLFLSSKMTQIKVMEVVEMTKIMTKTTFFKNILFILYREYGKYEFYNPYIGSFINIFVIFVIIGYIYTF